MGATVTRKNPKAIEKVLARYKTNSVLAVGFPSSKSGGLAYPDGTPVVDVATYNNFGTEDIPRRDFMTPGGKNAVEKTQTIRRQAVSKINAGQQTVEDALEKMGAVSAAELSKAIVDLDQPPNKPSTAERKGSSNPLVDMGLLKNSATYEVRSK